MARGFVRKRGDIWYSYWREGGRQRAKAVSPNKKEAEAYLNHMIQRVQAGEWTALRKATFSEFAAEYMSDYARPELAPSTYENLGYMLNARILPWFGHLQMSDINAVGIRKFIASLHEPPSGLSRHALDAWTPLSDSTVTKYFVTLKAMLNRAVEWGYIRSNPAKDVKSKYGSSRGVRRVSFFEPAEIRAFLKAVPAEYRALFTTLIFAGLRLGEALALHWSDIDWKREMIHVNRNIWRGKLKKPKSESAIRTVIMSPHLKRSLAEHRIAATHPDTDLVFHSSDGRPLDPANLRSRVFKPALSRAKLPERRIHDCRHTFATLLINQGESLKFVQTQLGHASIRITVDTYGHLLRQTAENAAKRFDETVFGPAKSMDSEAGAG